MREHYPVPIILSALGTLHNGAQRDSKSNASSWGSLSFKRTDKDTERRVKSSTQFE